MSTELRQTLHRYERAFPTTPKPPSAASRPEGMPPTRSAAATVAQDARGSESSARRSPVPGPSSGPRESQVDAAFDAIIIARSPFARHRREAESGAAAGPDLEWDGGPGTSTVAAPTSGDPAADNGHDAGAHAHARSDSARLALSALSELRSKAEAKLRSAEQTVARADVIEAEAIQNRASATQLPIQKAHAHAAAIELTAKAELAAAELRAKAMMTEAKAEAKALKLLAQTRREIDDMCTGLVPAATSLSAAREPEVLVTERAIFHPSDGGFDEVCAPAPAPTDGAGVDIAGAQFDSRGVEINDTGIEFDERGIEVQQLEDASQTERLKTRRGRGGLRTIDTIVEMPSPSPNPSLAEDEQDEQDDAGDEIVVGFGSGSDCDNADDADDVLTDIPAHLTDPSLPPIERLQREFPSASIAELQGHLRLTSDDAAGAAMSYANTLACRTENSRPEEAEPLDLGHLDAMPRCTANDADFEVGAAQAQGDLPPIGLGVRPLNEFDGPGGFTEIRYSSANRPSSASRRLQAIKTLRVSARGAKRRVDLDKLTKPVRGTSCQALPQQQTGVREYGKTRTQLLREKRKTEASAQANEAAMQHHRHAARLKKERVALARRGQARVREKELGKLQTHLRWQNARKLAEFEAVDEALQRRHKTAAGTTHFWTVRQKNIASASAKIKARNKMAREIEVDAGIDRHRLGQTVVSADGGVWPQTIRGDTFNWSTGTKTTMTMLKDADTLLTEAFARKVPQATSERNTWESAVTPGYHSMQTMYNSTLQVKLMNSILREELAEMQTDFVAMSQEKEGFRKKLHHAEGVFQHEREMLLIADCEHLVHDMCATFSLTIKDAHNGLGVQLVSPGSKTQGNRVRELQPNGPFDHAGTAVGCVFLMINGEPVHKRRMEQIRQMLQTAAEAGPVVIMGAHAKAWDAITMQEQDVLVASLIGDKGMIAELVGASYHAENLASSYREAQVSVRVVLKNKMYHHCVLLGKFTSEHVEQLRQPEAAHEVILGRYDLPGGVLYSEGTLEASAINMVREQTGIELDKVAPLYSGNVVNADGSLKHLVTYLVGDVSPDSEPRTLGPPGCIGWYWYDTRRKIPSPLDPAFQALMDNVNLFDGEPQQTYEDLPTSFHPAVSFAGEDSAEDSRETPAEARRDSA